MRNLIVAIFLLFPIFNLSQTFNIHKNDGNTSNIELSNIDSITFTNNDDISVSIDGIIDSTEWSNSKSISISQNYTLKYKQDKNYYYLAIDEQTFKSFYIDMFLLHSDTLFNIHASAKLGQRVLIGNSWTDRSPPIKWGNNTNWIANTVLFKNNKIVPYEGIEFRFSKEVWSLENIPIRIEIRAMLGSFLDIIFPENSERKNTTNWYNINW